MPFATSSQRVIPPKMLKNTAFTCGSRVITSSASTTPWASPPPPRSQKLAGRAAGECDHVDGRHRQPGAVPEHADLAVELYVGDALLARQRLERVGGAIAHRGDLRMPVERVVVDRELRVERLHRSIRCDDQRVDLAEHRVEARTPRTASPRSRRSASAPTGHDPRLVHEPSRLPGVEPLQRIDVKSHERLRRRRSDLFDVHASLRGEHEERLPGPTIEREREVVLLRDLRRLLDPDLVDDVAADVEPEDVSRTASASAGSRRA